MSFPLINVSQFFDSSGAPLAAGTVEFRSPTTNAYINTYPTADDADAQTNANDNPLTLNARGEAATGIYLEDGVKYKIILKDSEGATIWTQDDVQCPDPPETQASIGLLLYPQTTDEATAGVTPTDYSYPVGNVKRYGATGDGVTNDTTAFKNCSLVITQQDGGVFFIPPGTYIVGNQTLAGATGQGYAYTYDAIVYPDSCTQPVVIEGNGATLKMADGLKLGAFDPVTGNSYASTPPFTNADYKASIGYLVHPRKCANVTVRNLELDGNLQNITLGGEWGDTGYQIAATGLAFEECDQSIAENIYTHHNGLDGVYVGYPSLTETSEATPTTLINVRSEYNARQGLSWVGGIGLTAIDCKFNHTGKSTFASQPKAGVDVEPNGSDVNRNGTFINCEMVNNGGVGFLADTGDSADISLQRCKIVGTTAYSVWPQKPRISFEDCLIVGTYVNSDAGVAPDTADATRYTRCVFSDDAKYGGTIYLNSSMLSLSSYQPGVTYTDCTFNCTTSKPGRFDNTNLTRCTFNLEAGTGYISDTDWVIWVNGAVIDSIVVNDNIVTNPPATAYYISMSSGWNVQIMRGVSTLTSASSKVLWQSATTGYTGALYNSEQRAYSIRLGGYYNAALVVTADDAAPTTGTWTQGDVVFNSGAAAAGTVGWVCVTGGTPGTWKTFGTIAA